MNLFAKKKQTQQTWKMELWLPKGKGGGAEEWIGILRINIHTLLYIKEIINKDLFVDSPANCTQ